MNRDVLISCRRWAKDGSRIADGAAIIVPECALISVYQDWAYDGKGDTYLEDRDGHACVVQLQAKDLKAGMSIPGCHDETLFVTEVSVSPESVPEGA